MFNGYGGFSPGIKRPEREVNQSLQSSAEVKNEWSCTSAVPIRLRGVTRGNSAFNFREIRAVGCDNGVKYTKALASTVYSSFSVQAAGMY